MANIDWKDMRWNGKLSWAVDLLYYDKINVDITHPPYCGRDRNSSFFFKTRPWYIWDVSIKQALLDYHFEEEDEDFLDRERDIADIKILWDDNCTKESWVIYYLCITRDWHYKTVLTRRIDWWCAENNTYTPKNAYRATSYTVDRWCKCSDNRLFTTTYVKGQAQVVMVDKIDPSFIVRDAHGSWIQINRKEGWVVRWYFSDQNVIDWFKEFRYRVWDYLVVYGSTNADWSWFCWQVRTIVGKSKWGELILNEPRLWFQDVLDENWEVRWKWISYRVYHEYWDVIWYTSSDWVKIIVDPEDEDASYRSLSMCDFHMWWSEAWCIISATTDVNRIYFLYENGYIHYWEVGMNKFFSLTDDSIYAWNDKSVITTYRDAILAFWKRHIAVWLWDDTWTYARMYNQSTSIWVKNRYAFGEYNWDMLFISNDNRLLALQFENTAWTHMLNFQDVWAYANSFINAMLPTDEAYIWVDNNELRIFINSRADVDSGTRNTRTTILKYNTIFQTRTVDELKYFIIRWCYDGLYYWEDVYYRWWDKDFWVRLLKQDESYILEEREYDINISAFLLENENNGMSNTYASADLFNLASLQKLILLLWTWRYSDELTKLRITEWRWWWWRQYEIKCLENNDWVKMIWYAYNSEQLNEEFIEKKKCVLDSLNDGSKQPRVKCEEWHKVQDPIQQIPWCNYVYKTTIDDDDDENRKLMPLYEDAQLWEHNVCVNDEIYELAPTMPLTINLWDQENYNSGIKVELISRNWDVVNFWWFMAQLHFATLWQYVWWDWEYQISIDTGC